MRLKKIGENVLQWLFTNYLKWIERTVTIRWDEENRYGDSQIFGFWHEDSFLMNLLLRRLSEGRDIAVIVTSDGRGDYIENIIKRCNGKAIRVPDGCRSRDFLRNLIEEAGCPGKTLAAAMDGPLGPRRVPKTLGFYLAEKGRRISSKSRPGIPELFV